MRILPICLPTARPTQGIHMPPMLTPVLKRCSVNISHTESSTPLSLCLCLCSTSRDGAGLNCHRGAGGVEGEVQGRSSGSGASSVHPCGGMGTVWVLYRKWEDLREWVMDAVSLSLHPGLCASVCLAFAAVCLS